MSRVTRSARGEAVNFDLLTIKQQLASTPAPVNVSARRNFIDERDGIRNRENTIYTPPLLTQAETKAMSTQVLNQDAFQELLDEEPVIKVTTTEQPIVEGDPLALAAEAVKVSAKNKNKSE